MTPCRLVGVYKRFGRIYCLLIQGISKMKTDYIDVTTQKSTIVHISVEIGIWVGLGGHYIVTGRPFNTSFANICVFYVHEIKLFLLRVTRI
jgi:hypothetical protein